jgi:hypothetical protein
MRWFLAIGGVLVLGLIGLAAGWFLGQGLDASGIMDAETIWKTDPENMWAWSAISGGAVGLTLGAALVAIAAFRQQPKGR